MSFEIFQLSGSDETPILGVTKLRCLLPRCPLLFTRWLGYCTIALLQREKKKLALLKPPKKTSKIVLSLPKWNKWEKARWFLVFAHQEQGKDISVVVWPFSWLIIKLWMKILPTCGSSQREALKTRSCSGFDLCIVPVWKLKNKQVFRIGLADCPYVEP